MLKSDANAVASTPLNHAVVYKCPICRQSTTIDAENRPMNVTLMSLVEETVPEYEAQRREILAAIASWIEQTGFTTPSSCTSLPALALSVRKQRAKELYEIVYRIVEKAAALGLRYVTIDTMVDEITEFLDDLAKLLFAKGVHSIKVYSRRQVTIYILDCAERELQTWSQQELINPEYVEQSDDQMVAEADV
jgi:hypothetical protein